MKKVVLFFSLCVTALGLFAQSPDSFQYQAVVRDGNGDIVPDQQVSFQISIISGSAIGTVEYIETHAVTTNAFGLVTMSVGNGTVVSGDITIIDWGSAMHFMKVELDIAGGTAYSDMGTVQLLSVPYALHAKTAANSFSGDYNDLVNTPDFTGWDQDSTNDFDGDYNNLTNLPDFTSWDQNASNDFSGNYTDLTNKPVLAGDVTGQIESNTVTGIQGMDISTNIPANGQVLKWNNLTSTWEPNDDQLGAAGTTDGVVTSASFTGTTTKTLTLIRSNGLGDITAVFTDLVDDADADPANELQSLSLSGSDLTISGGNTVTLPVSAYIAGTGIDITTNIITNTAPDQTVALTGNGATSVSGTYPNFTVSSTDNNTTYTAGTGININGSNQISNTAPDQVVSMNNGTGITVSGTYPSFTVSNTLPDQTVAITGGGATTVIGTYPNFTISSTDNNTEYSAGTGIGISGNTINNTAPDQTVIVTGTGATTVTGTYPNFTVNSADNNTTYTAGTGLNLTGTTFSNAAPDQTVTLNTGTGITVSGAYPDYTITNSAPNQPVSITGSGSTNVTGTYPNFTVSSTDNNTTYTAGTGLALTGTSFSHNAHTGDATGATALTVTGIQGRQVTTSVPGDNQILKWSTANNRWELGEDQLGAAGTNDGVVTSINVTGTTTKTITLTRSQSLSDLTAIFTDEGSVYTAGTGIDITGNTVTNTAPDQTVVLTGTGSSTVTGTYPNFTVNSTDNNTTYTAGTGLTLTGTEFTHNAHGGDVTGTTNLSVTGIRGINVSSTAPVSGQIMKYNGIRWMMEADENTTYTATGTGLSLTGTSFTNTAPDQTVTLTQGGSTIISGSYPNFTISSTDLNTTYSAGTGLTLTSTTFAHDVHSGDVSGTTSLSVTGIRGRSVSTTAPTSGQILKYNGTNWDPAADDNTTYTAGTGLSLTGTQFVNTAPDQTVTLTQGGATTITGTYPNFTISSTDNNSGGTVTSIATGDGITGGTITSTGTLGLTGQALALHNLATNGIIVRTSAGNVTARTITGSTGISVTNGNGVSGNPTLTPVFGTTTGTIAEGTHTHTAYGAAGTNGMVQFNNNGNFGATANLFWDNTNTRLGIGTNAPAGMMVVKQTTTTPSTEPLFEVRDKDGLQVFAVYEDSVMIYVSDDAAKTNKGAFAVSGRNTAKTPTNEYLRVTPDSVRVFIDEDFVATGETRGGFEVGGFSASKSGESSFFNIEAGNSPEVILTSEPRVLWYPAKEAFMAGRVLIQSVDSVGLNSWATGFESRSIGNYSQALGFSARAYGLNSTAIGRYANATGTNSIAIGDSAQARGIGSYAIGSVGRDSLGNSLGFPTVAIGNHSFAFGLGATSTALGAFSLGINTLASGINSTAIGNGTEASGKFSFAGGDNSEAWGRSSVAIGYMCQSGNYAFAAGNGSVASGNYSAALGSSFAENQGAFATGILCTANGVGSTAVGQENLSSGQSSFASGFMSVASGDQSAAIGETNVASGDQSIAFGSFNTASGYMSMAFGSHTIASGTLSESHGKGIRASGMYTIAYGLGDYTGTIVTDSSVFVIMGGDVGIGTISPQYMLDVAGTSNLNKSIATGTALYVNSNPAVGLYATYFDWGATGYFNYFHDNVGIRTTSPSYDLGIKFKSAGDTASIGVERINVITASNAGLIVTAGGGRSGGTNAAGGKLVLKSGTSTGTGSSDIAFYTATAGASGTTDNLPTQKMVIRGNGRVGIGTVTPVTVLEAEADGATVATFDRASSDGTILAFQRDGAQQGTISVAAGVVSYNAFTGSHYGITNENIEMGKLVVLNGSNSYLNGNTYSEILYGISECNTENAPDVLGAFLHIQDEAIPYCNENPYLVMAVGNGVMWVADYGENLKTGDYLIASSVSGHAMKDNGEYEVANVIARVAEPVEWGNVTTEINGVKHKLVSVFFENFKLYHYETRIQNLEQQIDKINAKLGESASK